MELQNVQSEAKRERDYEEEECLNVVKQRRSSLSDLLSKDDDEATFTAESIFYDQELISGVMKSLAEEITCSNPTIPISEPSPSVDNPSFSIPAASVDNVSSNVDLEFLLGATDDELGIPPSPNCVAENETVNSIVVQNPVLDLFESPECQPEGLLQFCDSDCFYPPFEYEFAMLNDPLFQDWQARSIQGDAISDCYG